MWVKCILYTWKSQSFQCSHIAITHIIAITTWNNKVNCAHFNYSEFLQETNKEQTDTKNMDILQCECSPGGNFGNSAKAYKLTIKHFWEWFEHNADQTTFPVKW